MALPSFIVAHQGIDGAFHAHRVKAKDADAARSKVVAAHQGHEVLDVHPDHGEPIHAIGTAFVEVADMTAN